MSEERAGEGVPGGKVQAEIVLGGAEVMGLWSALGLAERRHDILLVDAWPVTHPRATSSGESRVIRCGYGGSSFYSSWAWRAVKLWKRAARYSHLCRPVSQSVILGIESTYLPASASLHSAIPG